MSTRSKRLAAASAGETPATKVAKISASNHVGNGPVSPPLQTPGKKTKGKQPGRSQSQRVGNVARSGACAGGVGGGGGRGLVMPRI